MTGPKLTDVPEATAAELAETKKWNRNTLVNNAFGQLAIDLGSAAKAIGELLTAFDLLRKRADAADELLEALEKLIPWAEAYQPFSKGHMGLESDIQEAVAAISKARGAP